MYGIHLFNDVVLAATSRRHVIPQRPSSRASLLDILSTSVEHSTAVHPVNPAPNPPCAAVDTAKASARLQSVIQGSDGQSQRLFVVHDTRPSSFDKLRIAAVKERKVFPHEWSRDHKTSADHGKIGFSNAEGGGNDDSAAHIGSVLHARDEVSTDHAEDTGSVA